MPSAETFVLDASIAIEASTLAAGFDDLPAGAVGPPLLWSEVTSGLRRAVFRGQLSRESGRAALGRFLAASIPMRRPARLHQEAFALAEQLGWSKSYDAEYVALARLLDCPLATFDRRLERAAAGLVEIRRVDDG